MKPSENNPSPKPQIQGCPYGEHKSMSPLSGHSRKPLAQIILGAVLLYFVLMRFEVVGAFLGRIISVTMPFMVGGVLAFILNIPLGALERRVFSKIQAPKFQPFVRPLSIVLSLLIFIAVITLVSVLVFPNLVNTLTTLANQIPGLIRSFDAWLNEIELPQTKQIIDRIQDMVMKINIQDVTNSLIHFLSSGPNVSGIGGFITSAFGTVVNAFVGIVFAVYLLANKETLGRQTRKLVYAYLPEPTADYVNHVASVTFRNFHGFFTGQFTEAIIVGILCFIGMSILKLPYVAMLSVLAAFTNLIPIAGAWIGTAIGALMIAAVNPVQALVYIVFSLLLQQFESNLIYPRVMGSSVGLPSMWVLVAITVGGSLMGLVGMIFFVPLTSVIYTLVAESANDRLDDKRIDIESKMELEKKED